MAGTSVVAGAAVLGAVPSEVLAQTDPDNEISGTVTDAQGAVDGATVVAVPHDSSLDPLVTTTDANGDYVFNESSLYTGDNLYHVIARDGTESDPRRGQENYPFLLANGGTGIPASAISRWTFDDADTSSGTAVDSWGDNDGTINGATTGVSGIAGYDNGEAYDFDGIDDWVNFGDIDAADGTNAFSVSIWISPDDVSTFQMVYNKTSTNVWSINITDSGQPRWQCRDSNGNSGLAVGSSLSVDTVVHLVGTWDSGSIVLYVDGSQAGTDSVAGSTLASTNDVVKVGGEDPGGYSHFDGVADDPRMYDKALSATEVSNLNSTGSISG